MDSSTNSSEQSYSPEITRRKALVAGGTVTLAAGGATFLASPAAAESEAEFEIIGDVAITDGVLEYVALTDYHSNVSWENQPTDIESVQARKYVEIEGDHEADQQITQTSVVEADESGREGSYVLVDEENTADFIIIGEDTDMGDYEALNTEMHDPYDPEGAMDGDGLEFTVTIKQEFDLIDGDSEVVDVAEAEASFTVSVDDESEAEIDGGANTDAQ